MNSIAPESVLGPFTGDKMFLHGDRLADGLAGKMPVPVTVELDVTNLCNHACPGCNYSYLVNIDKSSIPFDLAKAVIQELGEIGVKALTFSGGGEPLVYGEDRVLELMTLARCCGMDTALITNGSRLTSERFLDLCEWVRVSLDGYDAETFERFHGRKSGEFDKVCGRLRDFCSLAAKRKAAGERCATVGVGFLTDSGSVGRSDLPKMACFCAGFEGLDYLQFRPLVENMVADPSLTGQALLSQKDLAAIHSAYQDARKYAKAGFRVVLSGGKYQALSQPHAGRTYSKCLAHFLEAVISADSKVYICCHTQGQEQFCLGDLKQNTFLEIWRSDRAKQVYESTDPMSMCQPACRLHLQNAGLHQLSQAVHPNFI